MLVMAQTLKEISQAKETLIFLLQNLGFVINLKKSQLKPVKEIEFLGLVINSVNMTLALPQEKVLDIQNKCAQLIASPKTTIMELTKLLGKLSFTAQAVLPGRIQCRYLQQQIQAAKEASSCQAKVKLNQQSLAELKWWKENLLLQNGKPLKIGIPQLMIQTDASKTGWGQSFREPPRGNLVISGKDKTYQYTRAHCSETCNIDLYQRQIRNRNPLTNKQYDNSVLLGKNGGEFAVPNCYK